MARPAWIAEVERLAETVAKGRGLTLVAVDVVGEGRRTIIRVSVEDENENGPNVDRCAEIAEELGRALDLHDPVPHTYTLEVASPGLDRPLRSESDYQRFSGRKIEVTTSEPINGRRRWKGRLVGLEGENVIVDVDGGRAALPISLISRAHLVVEMEDLRVDLARGGRVTP
jgi:ribosome maturation factor RimP